jgi:ABC-type transporter Mla MlaB component
MMISTHNLSPVQEAAVAFADGRSQDARRLLESVVEAGAADAERGWALLLALCRIEGDWRGFDAVAGRYAQATGRPRPAWLRADDLANLAPELRSGGAACVEITGALDERAVPRLDHARRLAQHQPSLHLDLSRVDGIDQDGARQVSGLVRFLAANGNALLLTGAPELIALLRQAVAGDGNLSDYWTLLLDLYQLEGLREDFERAALEYALAASVPAPEWQAVVMPLLPRTAPREQRDEPRYQAGPEVIALSGVVGGSGSEQLAAIEAFAEARRYVNVDLDDLTRIAPAAASALVRTINALAASRTVRLLRPNPLVETLLATLELDPGVQLIRAQSL